MNLKVKEEYYCNVCDYYDSQIQQIREYLDEFKAQYQALFESIDFGENLGRVLVGKADAFYADSIDLLSNLIAEVITVTNGFMDDINEDDVLS